MKRFLSILNAIALVAAIVAFCVMPVIIIGDREFTGMNYLFGYKETQKLLLTEVEVVYFVGKPTLGLVMAIATAAAALLALLNVFVNKKFQRFGLALILVCSIVAICYSIVMRVNSNVLANYGDGALLAIAVNGTPTVGIGAYIFMIGNAIAAVFSFLGLIGK